MPFDALWPLRHFRTASLNKSIFKTPTSGPSSEGREESSCNEMMPSQLFHFLEKHMAACRVCHALPDVHPLIIPII